MWQCAGYLTCASAGNSMLLGWGEAGRGEVAREKFKINSDTYSTIPMMVLIDTCMSHTVPSGCFIPNAINFGCHDVNDQGS